ncbi:RNHCP domain-containing protein [Geomicrobium sp. JCM 19055]|uniref:RNHCP domain-containing protein n=1 Tax=Geomicrobium sp. JCM 19055 TaxID=1460649 RepID=UPI00223616BE|nr:RNHCP domain-containing protein [Geomicrobium sp. JCM 19055]
MVVEPLENGSYRNHCPSCLYSKHVDVIPGDRASTCHSLMEPIDLKSHSKKRLSIATSMSCMWS